MAASTRLWFTGCEYLWTSMKTGMNTGDEKIRSFQRINFVIVMLRYFEAFALNPQHSSLVFNAIRRGESFNDHWNEDQADD